MQVVKVPLTLFCTKMAFVPFGAHDGSTFSLRIGKTATALAVLGSCFILVESFNVTVESGCWKSTVTPMVWWKPLP